MDASHVRGIAKHLILRAHADFVAMCSDLPPSPRPYCVCGDNRVLTGTTGLLARPVIRQDGLPRREGAARVRRTDTGGSVAVSTIVSCARAHTLIDRCPGSFRRRVSRAVDADGTATAARGWYVSVSTDLGRLPYPPTLPTGLNYSRAAATDRVIASPSCVRSTPPPAHVSLGGGRYGRDAQ